MEESFDGSEIMTTLQDFQLAVNEPTHISGFQFMSRIFIFIYVFIFLTMMQSTNTNDTNTTVLQRQRSKIIRGFYIIQINKIIDL